MDGKIYETLEAVRVYLQTNLPKLNRVEIFEGVFDDDAVKQFVTARDVLRLSFLGAARVDERAGGESFLYASFGIYTVTSGADKSRVGINRMEAALALLMQAGEGEAEGLGVTHLLSPIPGEIQNLYTKDAGEKGVAIYGASIVIPIVFGKAIFGRDNVEYDPAQFRYISDEGDVILDPLNDEMIHD